MSCFVFFNVFCLTSLGHCYLMQDDLQKAYSAYQQALYLLPNPKVSPVLRSSAPTDLNSKAQEDPKLWYGIGILYDRYGSLDHAEEAFSSVLRMDKGTSFIDYRLTSHLPSFIRL
jgi:general transcriptional corepressor CYC8